MSLSLTTALSPAAPLPSVQVSVVSHVINTVYLELRLFCSEMKQYGRNSTGDATGLLFYSRSIGSRAKSYCTDTCFLFQHFIRLHSFLHEQIAYCGGRNCNLRGIKMEWQETEVDGRTVLKWFLFSKDDLNRWSYGLQLHGDWCTINWEECYSVQGLNWKDLRLDRV